MVCSDDAARDECNANELREVCAVEGTGVVVLGFAHEKQRDSASARVVFDSMCSLTAAVVCRLGSGLKHSVCCVRHERNRSYSTKDQKTGHMWKVNHRKLVT